MMDMITNPFKHSTFASYIKQTFKPYCLHLLYYGTLCLLPLLIFLIFLYEGFQQTFQRCCGTSLFELGPLCIVSMRTFLDAFKYNF